MTTECWIVAYDDGRISGPFKVFNNKEKAQEFVRLCADPKRVLVSAEMLDSAPSAARYSQWQSTQIYYGYAQNQIVGLNSYNHAGYSNNASDASVLNILGLV